MGRDDCFNNCPLVAYCEFRAQEADWRLKDQEDVFRRRMEDVHEHYDLRPDEIDEAIDEEIAFMLAHPHYQDIGEPGFFYGLRDDLIDECHSGPFARRRYLLFGKKIVRCASLAQNDITKILRDYVPL